MWSLIRYYSEFNSKLQVILVFFLEPNITVSVGRNSKTVVLTSVKVVTRAEIKGCNHIVRCNKSKSEASFRAREEVTLKEEIIHERKSCDYSESEGVSKLK